MTPAYKQDRCIGRIEFFQADKEQLLALFV